MTKLVGMEAVLALRNEHRLAERHSRASPSNAIRPFFPQSMSSAASVEGSRIRAGRPSVALVRHIETPSPYAISSAAGLQAGIERSRP